jgi:hypothetical protein
MQMKLPGKELIAFIWSKDGEVIDFLFLMIGYDKNDISIHAINGQIIAAYMD